MEFMLNSSDENVNKNVKKASEKYDVNKVNKILNLIFK